MPGIDSRAPLRTETSSGSSGSPSFLPAWSSSADSASASWSSRPSGKRPSPMYATHASVVMVKPAGTLSAPRTRVISATLAPLPPSRSRMSFEPSAKSYTHFSIAAILPPSHGPETQVRVMRERLQDRPLGLLERARRGVWGIGQGAPEGGDEEVVRLLLERERV